VTFPNIRGVFLRGYNCNLLGWCPLVLLHLTDEDLKHAFRACLCADVAGDTLEGYVKIIRVEHDQISAVAHATKAADALLLVDAHDTISVTVDGIGGAHVDAFAALIAHSRLVCSVILNYSDG